MRKETDSVLSDLHGLESRAAKLDKPLARALAKAEIADAAWALDRQWSMKLLRDAYGITLPEEEEQVKLRNVTAGSAPTISSALQIARSAIRNRILEIASRDAAFREELARLAESKLGKLETHQLYTDLASKSIEAGDSETATDYALKAIDADPSMLNVGATIFEMAALDRKAADNLIVQYIERLRQFPVSQSNGSATRTYMFLRDLITNNNGMYLALAGKSGGSRLSPPGPIVLRAYVGYVIASLAALDQREPGSAIRFRGSLLAVWPLLNQYAPELLGPFSQLEKISRRPGEDASLPTPGDREAGGADTYEQRVRKALDSDQPDDVTINIAIGRGDFKRAHKMIDKLPDGPGKNQLVESLNAREAIDLAEKNEVDAAVGLAERLNRPESILQVYPVLLKKCLSVDNRWRVTPLVYQAIKQLKKADPSPVRPPPGMPETLINARVIDLVPTSLSKLAKSIMEMDEPLALAVLDETVMATNKTSLDSAEGRVGFDLDVFKRLAPQNEDRVRLAAESLTDQFRQIVALASIDQWKAGELEKKVRIEVTRKAK
jgi:DNA-directed RNA polymerase specialized sigma24 family protein